MARPRKRGLDYFPLDVNVFDDDKLFDVQSEYGPLGETVYLRLVCLVYRNGYYFKFESIDKLAAMVIRSIGSRWVESKREIADIINFLIECGLFSKRFSEMNILTSKGIQTRFKAATERRCSGIVEYSLIDGDKEFVNNVGTIEISQNRRSRSMLSVRLVLLTMWRKPVLWHGIFPIWSIVTRHGVIIVCRD